MVFSDNSIEGQFKKTLCHPNLPLILAYNENNNIDIYNEFGSQIHSISDTVNLPNASVAWHPVQPILAIECQKRIVLWKDGINIESGDDSAESTHESKLTCFKWNNDGSMLLSCDQTGKCILWKFSDFNISMAPLHTMLVTGTPVEHAAFFYLEKMWLIICVSANGNVYFGNSGAGQLEIQDLDLPSRVVSIIADENFLILLTDDLTMTRFVLTSSRLLMDKQVKLGSSPIMDTRLIHMDIIGPSVLAVISGGTSVRLVDLSSDEIHDLLIPGFENDRIRSCLFSNQGRYLVVGLDSGNLIAWKLVKSAESIEKYIWNLMPKLEVGTFIETMQFCWKNELIVLKSRDGFKIVTEKKPLITSNNYMAIMQSSSRKLVICPFFGFNLEPIAYVNDQPIKCLAMYDRKFLLATGSRAVFVEVDEDVQTRVCCSFAHSSTLWSMAEKSLFCCTADSSVDVLNYDGVVKHTFTLEGAKSKIISLNANGSFVSAATTDGYIICFDDSKRDPKSIFGVKNIRGKEGIAEIIDVKPNVNGTLLGVWCTVSNSRRLFIYSIADDILLKGVDFSDIESFHWDENDERLLVVVQTVSDNELKKEILFVFASNEIGLKLYERIVTDENFELLISSLCPYIIESKKTNDGTLLAVKNVMPIFQDQDLDTYTTQDRQHHTKVMMDFAYEVTCGHLEKALLHAKGLGKRTPWNSIVIMCIKAGRLDLAKICLGMAGKASALSQIRKQLSPDPKIDQKKKLALLAINFGCYSIAEQIYAEINDTIGIENLLMMQNKWQDAIDYAAKFDKIAEKNIRYKHGVFLKSSGRWNEAISSFEESDTHKYEVPLMFMDKQHEMSDIITAKKEYQIWLGRSAESNGDINTAFEYYKVADDAISMIRILCMQNQIEDAIEMSKRIENSSEACNYIAKFYDKSENWHLAIEWYTKAKCFRHAVRIAKQQELELDMLQIAMSGPKELMQEIAKHFESAGEIDKAANLYFKSGRLSKAIEMCMIKPNDCRHIFEMISTELNSSSDPRVLESCAKYFSQTGDHMKALELMIKSKNFNEAIKICQTKKVPLSEQDAEKIAESADNSVCIKLGNLMVEQGSFATACKLYMKAGDRVKAIQALLRTGDIEKITFFANVSGAKQPEIYVITANYLQSLDWRENKELIKNIISFYTKAKAFDSLAIFFESCAQFEVDEFSEYDKAEAALKEAGKSLQKYESSGTTAPINIGRLINRVNRKIEYTNMMKKAQAIVDGGEGDIEEGLKLCREMLEITKTGSEESNIIRDGDVYSMLISYYLSMGNRDIARETFGQMKSSVPGSRIHLYLDDGMLSTLGVDLDDADNGKGYDNIIDETLN